MAIRKVTNNALYIIVALDKEISTLSFEDNAILDINFYKNKIAYSMDKEYEGMLVAVEDNVVID